MGQDVRRTSDVNNLVQKSNYYYNLELFMVTFCSYLGNSRPVFFNPKSRDWGQLNPGIPGLQPLFRTMRPTSSLQFS